MSKIIRNTRPKPGTITCVTCEETGSVCPPCGEREGSGFESKDCYFEGEAQV